MVAASRLRIADLGWFAARPRVDAGWADVFCFDADRFAGGRRDVRALLDADERAEVQRLRSPDDRRRRSVARGVLRLILGAYLDLPAAAVPVRRDSRGRPYVARYGPAGPLHLSCTQAGAVSACAVSGAGAVGIDVEAVVASRFPARIAPVVLSVRERNAWAAVPRAERRRWLARTWVRKEALLKADGAGLAVDPTTFDAAPRPPAADGTASLPETLELRGWVLHDVAPADGYVGAVAIRGAPPVLALTTLLVEA